MAWTAANKENGTQASRFLLIISSKALSAPIACPRYGFPTGLYIGGKYVNIAQNAPTTIRVLISLLFFIRHSLSKA
jgi:hypothetical protein